ncbi:hypothetical protein M378DRAFT_17988 [Amanita muscaria Koide BX008]|uniref:Uncharacterized protein n=1 Tax=Amanita muscaria (strain Koide BX008) TaxID=946122 RepID=A0A0C2RYH6_AMAMK|nr:hypothetical protein M378DRAFT_17988 [Amanita muscaria Koide BX008]
MCIKVAGLFASGAETGRRACAFLTVVSMCLTEGPDTWRNAATEQYVTEKLLNARQALLAKGCYLGVADDRLAEKLVWERVGNAERLVTEEAAEVAAAECWTFFESGQQGRVPEPPSPVVLSAIVSVAEEDYCLTSCAMWTGPSDRAPSLADASATCVGVAPPHVVFADDYEQVLKNVRLLMEFGRTKGSAFQKGLLVDDGRLEFCHALFERVSSCTLAGGNKMSVCESASGALPAELRITGWPSDSEETRGALRSMVATHRVNYLEAFDMHGRLIAPREYRRHIKGALVQIHFTLRHWTVLGKDGRCYDAFAADIFSLRVLEPPVSYGLPVVPRKRKYYKLDPLTPDIFPKTLARAGEADSGVKQMG